MLPPVHLNENGKSEKLDITGARDDGNDEIVKFEKNIKSIGYIILLYILY